MTVSIITSECSSPIDDSFNTKAVPVQECEQKGDKSDSDIKKCSELFKTSILKFVFDCEKNKSCEINIEKACLKYGFQKRRFYDVLNVLESVGCCAKINTDVVIWYGLSNIPSTFETLQYTYKVNLPSSTLEDIFTNQQSIGISNLTVMLILCYLVIFLMDFYY